MFHFYCSRRATGAFSPQQVELGRMIMAADFAFAMVLATLAPSAAVTEILSPPTEVDVAYEQLSAGDTQAAIRHLESADTVDRDDPARLINLGTAYARDGRPADAAAMFRAALKSEQRWLELADGRWLDSHAAARLALARLDHSRALALR
jgi:tetratricopeptide (TPR) repeat protein